MVVYFYLVELSQHRYMVTRCHVIASLCLCLSMCACVYVGGRESGHKLNTFVEEYNLIDTTSSSASSSSSTTTSSSSSSSSSSTKASKRKVAAVAAGSPAVRAHTVSLFNIFTYLDERQLAELATVCHVISLMNQLQFICDRIPQSRLTAAAVVLLFANVI
jgi:hypothetical protein